MTNIIYADNQLYIEASVDRWQLVSTELNTPTTLLVATAEGLTAHPVFVEARNLSSATLARTQVARVILGYAPESDAWRLGMLLIDGNTNAAVVDTLSMQWCELAAWSSGDLDNNIKTVAQALARLINRPFQFIEPYADTRVPAFSKPADLKLVDTPVFGQPIAAATPLPTIPLQSLPLDLDEWRITLDADGLKFVRPAHWWIRNFVRMLIYAVLFSLFIILATGTRNSGFARVEPNWLPNAGLFIAIVLFGQLVLIGLKILRSNAVVIDTFKREVYSHGLVFPFVNWRVPFEAIDYVVLSQTAAKPQGRPNREAAMNIQQDVWIHVASGEDFYEIAEIEEIEGRSHAWDSVRRHDNQPIRRRLQLAEYDTPAHHAAIHIAERIGVPLYLDIRS